MTAMDDFLMLMISQLTKPIGKWVNQLIWRQFHLGISSLMIFPLLHWTDNKQTKIEKGQYLVLNVIIVVIQMIVVSLVSIEKDQIKGVILSDCILYVLVSLMSINIHYIKLELLTSF